MEEERLLKRKLSELRQKEALLRMDSSKEEELKEVSSLIEETRKEYTNVLLKQKNIILENGGKKK